MQYVQQGHLQIKCYQNLFYKNKGVLFFTVLFII